jgi:hypothetical protein
VIISGSTIIASHIGIIQEAINFLDLISRTLLRGASHVRAFLESLTTQVQVPTTLKCNEEERLCRE